MRVVVLGAGYAGLTAARRLERSLPESVELVVVDESATHLVQHELHRVVRYPSLAETLTVPLDEVLSRARVREARVTDVDADAGVATLETASADAESLEYDVGVVCLGAETAFYDLPGVEEHATPLKRLEHARAIRRQALAAGGGTAVVGGGGLSGVQVAGELATLSAERDIGLDVRLVEMAHRITPAFGEAFADAVRRELEARGVTVDGGVAVESADADAVGLADGRRVPYDLFVWAGGIRGPAALGGERLPVGADLQVSESTFVVGDAGAVVDDDGEAVPASAQTAVSEARVAAKNVLRLVNEARVTDEAPPEERRLEPYAFDAPGWVVSVGEGAVAQLGPVVLSGDPAKAVKAAIGAGHLGSVGAIERASELVRKALGWPAADAVDLPFDVAERIGEREPDSFGDLRASLVAGAIAASEGVSAGRTVDLTGVTRLADRDYPGSPADRFERTISGAVEATLAFGRPDDGDEE
jgi:NADH dehydrogenase